MPMISDAWIQLISPLIARLITSLIFMARSKARAGYNGIHSQPLWIRGSFDPALQTGHFICYSHRTDHVLPTADGFVVAE
jgi:hypothetical protein